MTPDLIELLQRADALVPGERVVLRVLGEADPGMLALAEIADQAHVPYSALGTTVASLRARRFVERFDVDGPREAPLYRLLPRGQAAYRDLERLAAHTALKPRRSQVPPMELVA